MDHRCDRPTWRNVVAGGRLGRGSYAEALGEECEIAWRERVATAHGCVRRLAAVCTGSGSRLALAPSSE